MSRISWRGHALFLEDLQILHQVADGEVGRIALAVVAEFLAGLERGDVRHRQLLAAVAAALKDGADQVFVLPGEAAEQDGHLVALFGGKCSLHWPVKVGGLVEPGDFAQARAFGFESLLDFRIIFDVNEIGRHIFLRD